MLSAVLLLLLAAPSPAVGSPPPPSFDVCDRLAAREPESEATAKCFDETAEALKKPEEGAARLQELLKRYPGSPWPTFYLAFLDTAQAGELFRMAAEGFAARHDAQGEFLARANTHRLLLNAGRFDEAGALADRVVKVAEDSGQPELIARARTLKARHLWSLGKDLEQAYLLLRQAEAVLIPNGTYHMQRDCLSGLGNLSLELGRYREGFDAFRRMAELAAAKQDRFAEATARYGMVRAKMDELGELPTEEGRRQVADLAQEALNVALTANNRAIQAKAHLILGFLSRGAEARQHFDACLAIADTAIDQSYCLNALARFLAPTDPRAAQETIDRSLALARGAEDYWSMAFAWRERMRVSWASGSVDRAVEDSRSALDAIEALRDQQAASSGKVEAFSTWSEDYYWLSGRLIEAAQAGQRDLETAFQVAERLRARGLVDTLEAAHAVPAEAAPLRQRRGSVLEQISGVQRRLMDPSLPANDRTTAMQELGRFRRRRSAISSPRRPRRWRARDGPTSRPSPASVRPWEPTTPSSPSRSRPGRTSGVASPAAPGSW
jgi:tetratricopeptide (TPR) repeat protein